MPFIRRGNRELLTHFNEWMESEQGSHDAYVDWLLHDHSNNPDLGISFKRSKEGRGYWCHDNWTTWGKPLVIMDPIQQRCVIITLVNV